MKKNAGKNRKGFSLIEIMVAIMILGTSYIGIIQAFPYAMSIIKTAENETIASFLAQEKIEEINQMTYAEVTTGAIETRHRLGGSGDKLYHFERQTDVVYVDSDLNDSVSDTGLKKIITTVYYTNSISKSEKEYTLKTVIVSR